MFYCSTTNKNHLTSDISIRVGSGDLAKYPFLSEAGDYLRQSGFGWEELERSEITDLLARATERINAAAAGEVDRRVEKFEIEILSFLVSLILVKSIGIDSLFRKFALSEARRAEEYLAADMRKSSEGQRHSLITKIFEDLFGLKVSFDSVTGFYSMSVRSYLARSLHFHEQEWKLVNRQVDDGKVFLEADETVRLVRNELVQLIFDRIKMMEIPKLPTAVKTTADAMRKRFIPQFEHSAAPLTAYPPCVNHALGMLAKGENLSHAARVMLATYLIAAGKNTEDIVAVFRSAPDFNEKITLYQIEHLAGTKGSRTKYSVPGCDKLKSQNLCYATAECEGIYNPIQFGRRKAN